MEIGMLWFDDGPAPIKEKVSQAVEFYSDKFGKKPTHCLVHPSTLDGREGVIAGVSVRQAKNVMPNHYWVGVDEKARRNHRQAVRRSQQAAQAGQLSERAA